MIIAMIQQLVMI